MSAWAPRRVLRLRGHAPQVVASHPLCSRYLLDRDLADIRDPYRGPVSSFFRFGRVQVASLTRSRHRCDDELQSITNAREAGSAEQIEVPLERSGLGTFRGQRRQSQHRRDGAQARILSLDCGGADRALCGEPFCALYGEPEMDRYVYPGFRTQFCVAPRAWVAVASQVCAMIPRQRATHKFYWTRR